MNCDCQFSNQIFIKVTSHIHCQEKRLALMKNLKHLKSPRKLLRNEFSEPNPWFEFINLIYYQFKIKGIIRFYGYTMLLGTLVEFV